MEQGDRPPYIPEKFRDDSLKSKKVMAKKPQKFDAPGNNNSELDNQIALLSDKDIPKPDENL